ncbi:MAG: hypothetical protein F4X17_19575 [Gemmatimonadetes bacterium]|nr:hypothetical protein [Gemmatimonadota bacterium]
MVEELFEQLRSAQEEVRNLEAECEELEDVKAEKFGEFIAADFILREKGEELKSARKLVINIKENIDSLLGM